MRSIRRLFDRFFDSWFEDPAEPVDDGSIRIHRDELATVVTITTGQTIEQLLGAASSKADELDDEASKKLDDAASKEDMAHKEYDETLLQARMRFSNRMQVVGQLRDDAHNRNMIAQVLSGFVQKLA